MSSRACVSKVAPFMGAWIEIRNYSAYLDRRLVAPFMGAWIEIRFMDYMVIADYVAPFMGAWIEIMLSLFAHR